MGNLLSPGVAVNEVDLTTTVASVGMSAGALAGKASWGPLNDVTLVGSEAELVNKFGKPTDDSATTFFTAANFLSYTDALYFVRTDNTTAEFEYSAANNNEIKFAVLSNTCAKKTLSGVFEITADSATIESTGAFVDIKSGDYLKIGTKVFTVVNVTDDSVTVNAAISDTAVTYESLDFYKPDSTKYIVSSTSLKAKNARVSDTIQLQCTTGSGANEVTTVVKYNIANIDDANFYTVDTSTVEETTVTTISEHSLLGNKVIVYQTISDDIAAAYTVPANVLDTPNVWETTNGKLFIYNGVLNATAEETTGSGQPGTGVCIKNETDYLENFANGVADNGMWAARYPGEYGNSIKVSMCPNRAAYESIVGTGFTSSTDIENAVYYNGDKVLSDYFTAGSIIKNVDTGEERTVVAVRIDANTNKEYLQINTEFTVGIISTNNIKAKWQYADLFGVAPGTSNFVAADNGLNDELHVVVIDQDGVITGNKGTVLEKYAFVSKAKNAKIENGVSNYYANQINNNSKYIYWCDNPYYAKNWGSNAKNTVFEEASNIKVPYTVQLAGGRNYYGNIDAEKILGYDMFRDPDGIDVSLILTGEANTTVAQYVINNVCEFRKNCIALISPEMSDVVDNAGHEVEDVIEFRNTLPTTSYAVMDSGWKYQYDKYNDTYRWIPLNGDIAGLCARTDYTNNAWWSPAGFNRGVIKNVIKLAYSPYKAERDDLYSAGINPVVNIVGEGVVLYGDKTMLSKPSAFSRINVRRLFIQLEKAISKSAKYFLFEFNDEFTRQQFRNMVIPYLQRVQAGRGIYDFKVVCDSSNNTPAVIDNNEFVGDIYIKPTRSINFIQLNFVAVATGVEFSEVVGSF